MFLLIILPILVSGYIIFTQNLLHYYRLHRYEGQLLYLGSVSFGLICTISGFLLISLLNKYVSESIDLFGYIFYLDIYDALNNIISPLIDNDKNSEQATWIILGTLSSLFIAKLWSTLSNYRLLIKSLDIPRFFLRIKLSITRGKWIPFKTSPILSLSQKTKILLMSSILKDSPLDSLFLDSYINEDYLMLTMDDRKVYVGRVISLGEPNESEGMDQEITITPFISGHRDKDTLSVTLTTKYSEISTDVALVLRQERIISATKFSEIIYSEFLAQKNQKAPSSQQTNVNTSPITGALSE